MATSHTEGNLPVCPPEAVERIAACAHPVLRNLQITQCYYELSIAFAARTGRVANWCTFATWASKQAGQTIRREDMERMLAACLQNDAAIGEAISVIRELEKDLGVGTTLEEVRHSILAKYIEQTAENAAGAVSRGNKKVFEEIAWQFAFFMQTCFADVRYSEENLIRFCRQLRPGPPPGGQDLLRQAFTHYYEAFFENDEPKKGEMCLLANLEIGLHEQTRLQPEIAEALNAGVVDIQIIKKQLRQLFLQKTNFWKKLVFLFKQLLGKTTLLDSATTALAEELQKTVRKLLTAHLMTLTLPTGRMQLGKDLLSSFPVGLMQLHNAELLALLTRIDPTPDSILQSGATDWADLPERMHFIADLFRCYQEEPTLFMAAFSPEQVAAIRMGTIPEGAL